MHDLEIEDASPQTVVALIKQLTTDCSDEAEMAGWPKPCAVGISLGGHIVDGTVVTFAPFMHWSQPVELSVMVREATGLPTGIYNDIDSLVVDACLFGPGVGLDSFAVLTFGAGVGYSLTFNGELVSCPDKSYGLVGHILVDPDGPRVFPDTRDARNACPTTRSRRNIRKSSDIPHHSTISHVTHARTNRKRRIW